MERVEVITSVGRRRQFTAGEKRAMVELDDHGSLAQKLRSEERFPLFQEVSEDYRELRIIKTSFRD